MTDDDAEARRRRAAKLREQIGRITGKPPPAGSPGGEGGQGPAPPRRPPSPRDFVERRMRELDKPGDGETGKGKPK